MTLTKLEICKQTGTWNVFTQTASEGILFVSERKCNACLRDHGGNVHCTNMLKNDKYTYMILYMYAHSNVFLGR